MPRPRLCFVGAIVGNKPGWVTTQAEILADLFCTEGWTVKTTSVHAARIPRLVDSLACIARWRKDIDIAVLTVHTGPGFALADALLRELQILGVPTIAVLRAGALPAFESEHVKWVHNTLSRADHLVAPSGFMVSQLQASQTVQSRIDGLETPSVIPNTIDLDRYDHKIRAELSPRMLWMRTFEDIYNPQMALHALVEIRKSHPDATLTMAGQDRGLLEATRSLARDLSLERSVTFAGFLNKQAKREAFNTHDIYLHTNQVDNTPVSVIEAAAAGLAIVATRVGGVPYLLDEGVDALLVDSGDASAMADAVDRLLRDSTLVGTLTTNARLMAEGCSWPTVRDSWSDLFDRVLASRAR